MVFSFSAHSKTPWSKKNQNELNYKDTCKWTIPLQNMHIFTSHYFWLSLLSLSLSLSLKFLSTHGNINLFSQFSEMPQNYSINFILLYSFWLHFSMKLYLINFLVFVVLPIYKHTLINCKMLLKRIH